jgi:hypothetical protein
VLPACDRTALAAATLAEGEALLARDRLEEAAERFQAAVRAFEEAGDAAGGARALLGLGRVLLGLEDPACRAVLEDAGTWLEDLGDEVGVRQVEQLLRAAESSIEQESPRSFHSAGLMRVSSEIPPPRD